MKNLGWMNDWDWNNKPQEWLDHIAGKDHVVEGREIGRCCTEHVCKTCGIKWSVDSSD